jgi:uncharacterized protein (DUF58 family)
VTSLLRRVRTTLRIHAHRKVRGLLDGEYTSVFHGRSLEFDDLRPYIAGDEVKDVDWKATARLGSLMTRRYVASRKHTVILVVDTGRSMAAMAASGESKKDLAILAAGTAGYIASRQGDLVALVSGDAETSRYLQPESTEAHLERMLQSIDQTTRLDGPHSDLSKQLDFVSRAFKRDRILIVIADDRPLGDSERRLLRRLSIQHEILWMTIGDADLMSSTYASAGMRDVDSAIDLPSFVRENPKLRAEFAASVRERATASEDLFDSLSISSQRIASEAEVVPGFFHLMQRHKNSGHRHARR